MKRNILTQPCLRRLAAVALALAAQIPLLAFPPAPDHVFQGLVRDEFGNPIRAANARVILETAAGWKKSAPIISGLRPGVNYQLQVPMDAGVTRDPYARGAQFTGAPFRVRVEIGTVTYLPIEMLGDFSHLGEPGRTTRLDLTLGADLDGDGLPDAWERAIMESLGLKDLTEVDPQGDADGDGQSNLDEYLSGNYAFDRNDGLQVSIAGFREGRPVLEFLTIRGRSYSIVASSDFTHWNPVSFRLPGDGTVVPLRSTYQADAVRALQVEVVDEPAAPAPRFFRLLVR